MSYYPINFIRTLLFFVGLMMSCILAAQEPDSLTSTEEILVDSISLSIDSLVKTDSTKIAKDSIPMPPVSNQRPANIAISKDAIDDEINYTARDSIVYNIKEKKIYLYGEANVIYEDLDLTAGKMVVDWGKNEVFAENALDSLKKPTEVPSFKSADQTFDAMKIRYNFKSKKGIIYDARSQYNDLYVLGSRAKILTPDQDSEEENSVYSSNAIFTTCDHPEPHYGIRSRKQKIIPDKVVVIGPSNLEIMGVPTPLVLPFGFFPISKTRTAGIIFPQDFTFSPAWGFGLDNIGYYTPINDNLDLSLTGDVYFNGTYGLHLTSNYKKIYKYTGSLNLNWSVRKQELRGIDEIQRSFSIRWSHSQDQRAHPTRSFQGSVNIQTNDYQSLNRNGAEDVLNNTLSSNINYRKSFSGKPYSFTATVGHSQNTNSNQVTLNFPTAEFKTQSLFPFKRKVKSGQEKWYEKISATYSARFRNQLVTTDTTLFTEESLEDIEFGIEQRISSSTSFKLLKYLNISPSVQYREVWQPRDLSRVYEFDDDIQIDTFYNADSSDFNVVTNAIRNDSIVDINDFGFNRWNNYSGGVSLNTQIFGTWVSNKGWLRGVRHLIKPTLSFNYSPSNIKEERGYFETLEYEDELGELQSVQYGVYEGGIFGSPTATGEQANISYGINNIFEAKVFSKKDSTVNKIKLFDNIRFNGSYNAAADSLNWSPISMSGTARLFKGLTTLNIGAAWSLYSEDDETNVTVNNFHFQETGKLARFTGGRANISTTFTIRRIRDLIKGENPNRDIEEERSRYGTISEIFEGFNFRHQVNLRLEPVDGRDSLVVATHTLTTSGSIQITDQWNVRIGNIGYDFRSNQLSYPDLGFSRNLHCWETGMSWQPTRGTYSFYIRVNPSSTLNFLKIPFDKRNVDGFNNL